MCVTIEELNESHFSDWSSQYIEYAKPWGEPMPTERILSVWGIIHSPSSNAYGIGAFDSDGLLLGFAHFMLTPCTYSRRHSCYLQDLYVAPDKRRQGLAKKLIEYIENKGRKAGWRTLSWRTRPQNEGAILLYEQIGKRSDWLYYEINLS